MNGMFLSIDFEDFAHDLKRDLRLWETGPLRIDRLWEGFEAIETFLEAQGGARVTFFCTGVIADQAPDLIAHIASRGHEIACHAHYHDTLDRMEAAEVDRALGRARTALEAAANREVTGFRAPKFRIDKTGPDQYRAVERRFAYDSSLNAGSVAQVAAFRAAMGLSTLRLLPIYRGQAVPGLPPLNLGGSYLKLFPARVADRLVAGAQAAGFTPHVYLHPYEFLSSGAFELTRAELAPLGPRKQLFWLTRQAQWHRVGNAGLPAKLGRLASTLGLGGRLCDNLDAADPLAA
ncbi:polysaccharide deacetylase family protein [Limimaricola litoreus]|uniref:Chitooligosaccharide deacetylase n=1 Tax=Limimaricola litoreus TaxID=2955316 RepID=A0A9X2FUH4_9RHOB|nr:polysaccharide deacetylase family protein [Limimaricola litoreus]MCP1167418.1 polysaccharide deacetylase family protein [Limimaricola litoreus]